MSRVKSANVRNQVIDRQTKIFVEHALPESPVLSLSALTGSESVVIEFKNVDYVNSTGLRSFSKWLKELEATYPDMIISFEAVPAAIARHLLILKDFLPKKLEVSSMLVPYYCNACDNEDHSTVINAQKLRAMPRYADALPETVICKVCGAKMEADVIPEKYLSLLDERSKW
jgi:anti-anti-sigma regulatory factor